VSYLLRMSDEIRDWLADLRDSEPVAARQVGASLTALITEGSGLAAPLVVALDGTPRPSPWSAGEPEALDESQQERLEQMQTVRRHHAEAAGLMKDIEQRVGDLETRQAQLGDQRWQALQEGKPEAAAQAVDELARVQGQLAELRQLLPRVTEAERRLYLKHQRQHERVTAFQARQEALEATRAAAEAEREIRETLARLGADLGAAGEPAQTPDDDRAAGLEERIAQIEGELRAPASAEGLMELRAGAPGQSDIRILFAVEPPGTALLIAVLEGRDTVEEQRDEAVALSTEVLRRFRAGQAPEAAAQAFDDVPSFLDEFFPGSADDVEAAAAALAARSRARTLAAARTRLDLTQEDVARRMGVRPGRVAAIERGEPGATEVRTLAAYVDALGGRLEIIADFGEERVVLR
jgi:phage shock protein A/DNA-binding XRE family transcriptional regulator